MRIIPHAYRGRRSPEPVVEFQQVPGEAWFPLPPMDLSFFITDGGYDWGFRGRSGAGPDQLALAILASRLEPEDALELFQSFAAQAIVRLADEWEMAGVVVDAFLMAQGAFAVAQIRHGAAGMLFLQAASLGVH